MGARLEALLELQDIELQIVDIRRQLAVKERRVRDQAGKLSALQASNEAARHEIQRSQAEFDELDVDIKGRSAHISRLREHLNTVRTNKEYAVVLAQMNNEKADVSRLESRALEMMERVEARKQLLAEQRAQEQAEQAKLDERTAELEQARQSFGPRLSQLERQREAAAAKIDAEALALFRRLSERYDGEIMAEVVRPSPRRDEFVCAGCNMALRTEVANALRIRDEILTCKNCGRILYLRNEA